MLRGGAMLTIPEKIFFVLLSLFSLSFAIFSINRIVKIIGRGKSAGTRRMDWKLILHRLLGTLARVIAMQPTYKIRLGPSILHAFIAWAFVYYLLVNLADVLKGLIPGFYFLESGTIGGVYRLIVDLLSVAALVAMIYFLIRRFILKTPQLRTRPEVFLDPAASRGILRDSAIVGSFILVHIGARFLGQSFSIALNGSDPWQPFASLVARLWSGWSDSALVVAEHVTFWLAVGTILLFIPYFLYSKHIHLFFAPINFLVKPQRRSIGELEKIDFDDESLEQFGATRLEHLGWEQFMDAYACIQCYRCQEVCPAYNTGKLLSPAAMEINKRYYINQAGAALAKGEPASKTLLEMAIPAEAVWACTACGACIQICPVNNEPMRDILDIRRSLVLMENSFPKQLQTAFRGMERQANPWGISPAERMKWAEGLEVPTIEENPEPEILWWVGCAPATDARAQKTARAFARILAAAAVNYAVLGESEQCTGDSARRAGKEDIFFGLAQANVEILNEVNPRRIVTTCPHCLHTLKNEYPAFGGNYTVIHHTQLINELISQGNLKLTHQSQITTHPSTITFHDPCYLGRQNGILEAPRQALGILGAELVEMPRSGAKSFCCGAGGAQMWKEEEHGTERVNTARFKEASATGAGALAVACPFCMIMLTDARKDAGSEMAVLDVAELIAGQL
jgi:Fe-S oxidoreductase